MPRRFVTLFVLLTIIPLAACAAPTPAATPTLTATATPAFTDTPVPTNTAIPTVPLTKVVAKGPTSGFSREAQDAVLAKSGLTMDQIDKKFKGNPLYTQEVGYGIPNKDYPFRDVVLRTIVVAGVDIDMSTHPIAIAQGIRSVKIVGVYNDQIGGLIPVVLGWTTSSGEFIQVAKADYTRTGVGYKGLTLNSPDEADQWINKNQGNIFEVDLIIAYDNVDHIGKPEPYFSDGYNSDAVPFLKDMQEYVDANTKSPELFVGDTVDISQVIAGMGPSDFGFFTKGFMIPK